MHERASLQRGLNLVATELCDADNYWNIVSADLKNEPFAMFWGAPGHARGRLVTILPSSGPVGCAGFRAGVSDLPALSPLGHLRAGRWPGRWPVQDAA